MSRLSEKNKQLQQTIKQTVSVSAEKWFKQLVRFGVRVEPWPENALILPRLQAHRGYWQSGAQENTLDAFRAAKVQGALMIECDVRLSKDQIPVVFHDQDLKRLCGLEKKVSELTAAELFQLAKAPSLKQVMTDPLVPRLINIEFKSKVVVDDPLERKVSELIKQLAAQDRVLFSSFNPFSLYRASLHLPDVPRALLVSEEPDADNHYLLRSMSLAPFFSFHLLHLDHRMLDEKLMRLWRQKRVPFAVWTVNGREQIQKYLKNGAISVISDSL